MVRFKLLNGERIRGESACNITPNFFRVRQILIRFSLRLSARRSNAIPRRSPGNAVRSGRMGKVFWGGTLTVVFLLVSCSIQYQTIADNSEEVPEFTLRNASVSRYEQGVLRVTASADLVEQYKKKNIYYAQNVECEIFEEDGTLQTKGIFGFVAADIDNKVYTFFDSVTVDNYSEKTSVRAETLKWSGKTGLLASGRESTVTIIREAEDNSSQENPEGNATTFSFTGSGFSADSNKRTYRFSEVSGKIDSRERE
jgi:LPS export ABC transporter protein LptC